MLTKHKPPAKQSWWSRTLRRRPTLTLIFVIAFALVGAIALKVAVTSPGPAPSSGPSGEAMPLGDLPNWHQVFTDDFVQNIPLGQFPGAVPAKWGVGGGGSTEYADGQGDTCSRNCPPGGTYYPSKVVSFHNGEMDLYLHTEHGVHMVAAPFPIIPGATGAKGGMRYGRYVERWKISGAMPGYKNAWLAWPDAEDGGGEIDFPETNFGLSADTSRTPYITASFHPLSGGAGTQIDSQITPDGWHTTAMEWTPAAIKYYIDGNLLGVATQNLPPRSMYYALQTETATEGSAPSSTTTGHVLVDWISIYAYKP